MDPFVFDSAMHTTADVWNYMRDDGRVALTVIVQFDNKQDALEEMKRIYGAIVTDYGGPVVGIYTYPDTVSQIRGINGVNSITVGCTPDSCPTLGAKEMKAVALIISATAIVVFVSFKLTR